MLTGQQRAGLAALPEPLPLGRSVERIFAERVSRLPPATQHLLLVAAAEETGDLTTVLQGAAAAGISLDALESAERAGLISVANGRLQFRHPLVRSAVYQHATFASRQGVHRDLAVVLRGQKISTVGPGTLPPRLSSRTRAWPRSLRTLPTAPAAAAVPGRPPTRCNGRRS